MGDKFHFVFLGESIACWKGRQPERSECFYSARQQRERRPDQEGCKAGKDSEQSDADVRGGFGKPEADADRENSCHGLVGTFTEEKILLPSMRRAERTRLHDRTKPWDQSSGMPR